MYFTAIETKLNSYLEVKEIEVQFASRSTFTFGQFDYEL